MNSTMALCVHISLLYSLHSVEAMSVQDTGSHLGKMYLVTRPTKYCWNW